jgi:hypothetical protein
MCEACLADMGSYKKKLGNFFLLRARKDWDYIEVGDFGLTECNGPTFLFSVKPWKDPMLGWSDDQINNATEEENNLADKWLNDVAIFAEQIGKNVDLTSMARLVKTALAEGFDPEHTDTTGSFPFWLFNKLAEMFESGEES